MRYDTGFYSTTEWQKLRAKVFKRDNYVCLHCGIRCLGKKRSLPSPHCDHIKPRATHPELSHQVDNLRTLCTSCHSKVTKAEQLNRPMIGADGYPVEPL